MNTIWVGYYAYTGGEGVQKPEIAFFYKDSALEWERKSPARFVKEVPIGDSNNIARILSGVNLMEQ